MPPKPSPVPSQEGLAVVELADLMYEQLRLCRVTEGEQVQPGQSLVVMEAMKMENELRATRAGRVTRIACKVGAAVEKGALLLEMED